MNAGSEALVIGNALKKSSQLLTLVLRQHCTECFVVLPCDATDVTECHLPFVGQVKLIRAPIVQAVLPLHKPALLQLIDDRHQTAWVHMKNAFNWFLGDNDLQIALYDPSTGGCRDGLHPDRANENQGAESTLSFLMALLEMRKLEQGTESK